MAKTKVGEGRYCYYYIEDGECSLDNPIVWKRLKVYVTRLIRFTGWIKNKSFADPQDILIATKEVLKDIPPIQYGDEHTDAITFLIKAINKQTGREYWKYLKEAQPHEYARLLAMQKVLNKNRTNKAYPRNYDNVKDKGRQQKLRDEVSDHYIMGLVYNNLKYQTGIKYTFDEIRDKYPFLIEKKRAEILKKRGL